MPRNPLSGLSDRTTLTRRELLGRAAGAAATLAVSQAFIGCAAANATAATSDVGCVLTAALTEGPYFVDERLNRSDIKSDPVTGLVSTGIPLGLTFNVSRNDNNACTPLTGAYVDVWHCDSAGVYSDVLGRGAGHRFLRGYQITNVTGAARFSTVYPGWYPGRAVHTHFKVRIIAGAATTYGFTSQFFFDEVLTDAVHAQSPYSAKGTRDTKNAQDGIYNGLSSTEKSALTIQTSVDGSGYTGVINLVIRVG